MQIDRVREVVGELDDLGALVDRGARDVLVARGDAPVLDLALLLEREHRLDRLAGVDRVGRRVVQEEDGDGLDAEPLARALDGAAQVGRVERLARRVGRAIDAALRDDDEVGVILQDLADEQLHAPAAVGVGGVDEREAHVDRAAEHLLGVGLVDGAVGLAREPPRADRELRDDETRLAERPFPHASPSITTRPLATPRRGTLQSAGTLDVRPGKARFEGRNHAFRGLS